MQLSEIEAFLAVVKSGSLSGAAEQLYITQPALSHRIQSLEKELGYQLFARSKGQRRVEMTANGREFILIAEKWSSLWAESKKIATYSPKPAFRVAATQTLSNYVMPEVYARFLGRKLPVSLELFSLHYRECYTSIEDRSVDAVFVSRTVPSNRVSSIPVLSEKMVLLCSEDSPYTGPVHPQDLPTDKCVYMLWNHEYAMWHEYWFGTGQYMVTADNMRLVEQIIESGDMWSIVPISAARAVVRTGKLRYLDLLASPPDRPIFLLTTEPQHEYTPLIVEDLRSVMNVPPVAFRDPATAGT